MYRDFDKWFETFWKEKEIDERVFEIEYKGVKHFIGMDVVKEFILNSGVQNKVRIKYILCRIDFENGDIYHFFKHIAEGCIKLKF